MPSFLIVPSAVPPSTTGSGSSGVVDWDGADGFSFC